jgi:capsular exopolysaccharide synthesis family protein
MSKIYEALKKAEREKEALKNERSTPSSPLAPADHSLVDQSSPQVAAAEEYRKMLNLLMTGNSDRNIRAIMMLSSVHGEGTSSVCAQFARSLLQVEGRKVLLVDANLRSPVQHKLFGLQRPGGLVELLKGMVEPHEIIKETGHAGLSVITAGEATEDTPDLLGSSRLKELLAEWKETYHYVLLDSAPILAYADAVILCQAVDGVVLVVHAGKTRREVIQQAQDTINKAQAKVLGVVLNRRRYVIPKGIYRRL